MAVGSESGGLGKSMEKAFYDPYYGAGGRSRYNNNNNNRKLFDDFSIANHVHILKPQSVSVDAYANTLYHQKSSAPVSASASDSVQHNDPPSQGGK